MYYSLSPRAFLIFFFNDTATTEIYTLSLHDALPISQAHRARRAGGLRRRVPLSGPSRTACGLGDVLQGRGGHARSPRSGEHTSELQARQYIVCRLLLGKKKHKT